MSATGIELLVNVAAKDGTPSDGRSAARMTLSPTWYQSSSRNRSRQGLEYGVGRREHGVSCIGRNIAEGVVQAGELKQLDQHGVIGAALGNVKDSARRLHREEHCVDDMHDP
eukprot:3672726-Rhodomonas_salina.2